MAQQQRDLRRVPDLMLHHVPEDVLDTENIVIIGDAACQLCGCERGQVGLGVRFDSSLVVEDV